jgi:hypothetical protein
MIWELNPHKAYEKVEYPGFYSCYKTGETIWLEKGSKFPGCEENIWISSEQA